MGETEYHLIKEDVAEIKNTVKAVETMGNDMRVMLVGQYVSKQEYENHKREDQNSRRWWATFIIASAGALMTLVKVVF